jgi:hypothetical protein
LKATPLKIYPEILKPPPLFYTGIKSPFTSYKLIPSPPSALANTFLFILDPDNCQLTPNVFMVVLFSRSILKLPAATYYKAPTKNTAIKKV